MTEETEIQSANVIPQELPAPEEFRVRDERTANWLVRKIVDARAYADRVESWAAAEIRRAQHEERWLLDRYGSQLRDWLETELAARGGRRRSVKLPAGKVGLRTRPPTLVTTDDVALMHWCRRHLPEALRMRIDARGQAADLLDSVIRERGMDLHCRQEVMLTQVRKVLEATGELPPGTELTERQEQLYIT
jgi:hypothetical protein